MSRALAFLGNATVRVPEDNNPDHGGGPTRRSPLVVMPSGDGMPPNGWPQMVLRTPHQVVYDAEPGGAAWPGLQYMKYLPDGRLVPANALGGAPATMEMGFGNPYYLGADPVQTAADATAAAAASTAAAAQKAARFSQAFADWIARWGVITLGAFVAAVAGAVLASHGSRMRTSAIAALGFGGGALFARYLAEHPTPGSFAVIPTTAPGAR
jgi:hypothetical protein